MFAATLAKANEITFGEPEYDVEDFVYSNGTTASYKMSIIIDGNDYTLDAVFDEDGNLINIYDYADNYDFQKFT